MPKHYLSHTENHLSVAKGYLPQQYKDRPNIEGLLAAIIQPLQEIEDKLYEIYRKHSPAEARGYYLDRIGALVGEPRNYREDDKYRLAILARIMINNAGGTPEDIINALRFTFNPRRLSYTEIYPACFSVFIQGGSIDSGSKSLTRSIIPAGISSFVIVFSAEDNPFIFAECSNEIVALEISTRAATEDKVRVKDNPEDNPEGNAGGNVEEEVEEKAEDNSFPAKVSTDTGMQRFNVSADVLLFPDGYLGFAEIIVTRNSFSLGGRDIYFVEDGIPLELIATYEDFKINGGSRMAEVIENG